MAHYANYCPLRISRYPHARQTYTSPVLGAIRDGYEEALTMATFLQLSETQPRV
jgi:hypothetical protein